MSTLTNEVETIENPEVVEIIENVDDIIDDNHDSNSASALLAVNTYQNKLKELDSKVKYAIQRANEAQTAVQDAGGKSTGLFKKKDAIEALQVSGESLSNAVIASTEVQKLSFEFQEQLAKISKGLFTLGVASIAMNRTVIRELEQKLKGATAEEMSDLVRQETLQLIRELKNQQNIMTNQKQQAGHIRQHEQKIAILEHRSSAVDKELAVHVAKDNQLDAAIKQQIEKDKKIDEALRKQIEKDDQLDAALLQQAQKDKELDEALKQQIEKDNQLDAALLQQAQKDKELDEALKQQIEKDNQLDAALLQQAQKDKEHEKELRQHAEKDKQLEEKLLKCFELLNIQGATIDSLKSSIDTKQNKSNIDKISFALSIATLAVLLVQFFPQ